MPDCDPKQLVLGPVSMKHHAQPDHDKGQPRRAKGEHAEEAEQRVGMPPAPDVDEGAAERGPEKGLMEEGRKAEEGGGGISQHPGKVGGRGGRLF